MQITYTLTERDFRSAAFASFTGKRRYRVYLVVFGSLFLLNLAALWAPVTPDQRSAAENLFPFSAFAIAWIGFVIFACPYWIGRRQFRGQPSAQGEKTAVFDGEGVNLRWTGGSAEMQWSNFVRFRESKLHMLLYASPASFHVFPKRAFTPEQLAQFRNLAEQHIPKAR